MQAQGPAPKGLLHVVITKVLDTLFPLQCRLDSHFREIIRATLTLQSSQKSVVALVSKGARLAVAKSTRWTTSKVRAEPIRVVTVRIGSDRICPFWQMIEVVGHPKPGIGELSSHSSDRIGAGRAIRGIQPYC